MTYADFINHVLKGNDYYLANVRRHDELLSYLCKYKEDSLPILKSDTNLLSFSNGVLELSTREFHSYSEPLPESIIGRVARHHIHSPPYTGSTETPLFDRVLNYQFDKGDGQYETLLALIGRTFFAVRFENRIFS
jgi:hypothetical protein